MRRFVSEILRLFQVRITQPSYWVKKIQEKERSNAVISLSILPTRFKGLTPTLNSLTDQSVLPEKIILNLPKAFERDKAEYDIPDYVLNHPLVEINWIEKDLGPATKLLPTLDLYKEEPDKLIIVLDDDQIYPRGMVENYIANSKQLPDAAMTLSGWTVPKSFDHKDKEQLYGGIVRFYRKDNSVTKPVRVDCLQGAASFAVKPKLFDARVFDFANAPREAFFVDDIWVSGNLSRNQSPVYVVPAPFRFGRFVSLRQSTKMGLSSTVNSDNTNNNTLYKYFDNVWWSLNK
ncbi:hypothetical protein [Reichenbachiella ulvae]|uniref:Glycosyl transferase family 2 n=1 Tax=Reichenbachiella ulvae TaxID=2980104 RepID=A0ABT3CSZ5_9BACT|nr:hypothetical protein [Reichenbachiella ulvae]MCV9386826.1 hypothetical protein [Reichenbachiella ulvae]